ncbi:Altered inheritance of mitochondria protein 19 [Wickerhamiella sorbophila]|uniref:Altered inheritance of mitochondria protein 19 n=1 Tax=Wickerhamiella sorbophila TaxID=45607 RepID=A0A2T0FCD7_9ASCO|nr:Altered inheritance of mitochondria protein 19 [Wickerhamiella sorbophila]PRT52630.1 Altered inheritance of mitochondria protein 19 [Wickerhamiella sorbophila]
MQDLLKLYATGTPAIATGGFLLGGLPRKAPAPGIPLRPSRLSCAGFGGAHLLGALMIYDGDVKNGAGFLAVWGWLYGLAHAGSFFKQPGLYGKSASLLATMSAAGYTLLFLYAPPTKPIEVPQTVPE